MYSGDAIRQPIEIVRGVIRMGRFYI